MDAELRIGIDARLFDESGIGRYIRNLLLKLGELDKNNEYFIFLLNKDLNKIELPDNFTKIEADIPWYTLKEQYSLPKLLSKYNLDLAHFPHFNIPIFYKKKFVVTIHDLIHQHFRMRKATTLDPVTYKIKQIGYRQIFKNAVEKSLKILVPSDYVKELLIKEWSIKEEKIVVTYEAVDEEMMRKCQNSIRRLADKSQVLFKKWNIKQPYIFYVGNAHPHKNIEGLIKAFLLLKETYKDLFLVLTGKDHYFWQIIKSKYRDKDIKYTGSVSDEELIALYKNATVYAVASFEEGFGIPVLEAFACRCPVAASNIEVLKEIASDAAVYFNPGDITDMAKVIKTLLDNYELREVLIEKGRKRCKEFSWEKLARETLEVYESCSST